MSLDAASRQEQRSEAEPLWKEDLKDKSVHFVGGYTRSPRVFVALHQQMFQAWYGECVIRNREQCADIQFGTLTLIIDQYRQRLSETSVGTVDIKTEPDEDDTDALLQWATADRTDMITGFFGSDRSTVRFVPAFAERVKAISCTPLFQGIEWRQRQLVHPNL